VSNPQNQPALTPAQIAAARKNEAWNQYMATIRDAARLYAEASPLSVPAAEAHRAVDRVMLAFRSLATVNPKIVDCTANSIARCMALCALTGLMPGGAVPEVDLIPRKRRFKDGNVWREVLELQWQVGWRGYKTLAARAGCTAKAVNVYQGDHFVWEEGLESKLVHRPNQGAQRQVGDIKTLDPLIACYVVATYADGRRDFIVIDLPAILKRREASEGWRYFVAGESKSSPWAEWADEMVMKTAMRYAASRGLLVLDDVARYAFQVDGEEDAPTRVVVDIPAASSAPAPAPAERPAISDRGGLDELSRDLGIDDDREPDLLTPDERIAENAKKSEAPPNTPGHPPAGASAEPTGDAPKAKPPTKKQQAEQAANDLVERIRGGEGNLAPERWQDIRKGLGIKVSTAAKDIVAEYGLDVANTYAGKLSNAVDEG
jgi:phage RecT family recombinase